MTRRAFLLLATLILLGGAFLRLAGLHDYPPGLHYDEAADMLLSRDIAWYGFRPFPVVAAYSGREALFYYVAAPLVRLMSADPHAPPVLATRLTSALLGILTIAVTIALGRAMFRGHRRAALIALLAGAWLAMNGPQVWLMRQGFRTSPQPLLEALALWMLFAALRRPAGRRWLLPAILGGLFAGLALYVYMAARIFPVWLALLLALYVMLERRAVLSRLRRAATFALAMAVTGTPIGIYYLQHPDVLFDRLAQVGPSGGTLTLAQSVQAHLEMFFLKGDPL
ncbi:MAG: hypothetical protein IT323_10585, partial [Anaerolineae bacterium]|nr:hypothetical protein [Anaerolineae bacterium]